MPIIVTSNGERATRLAKSRFTNESDLQAFIKANPEVIPVEELKEDAKLVVIERESPTMAGPIDLLAADQNGELYIIETKLYRNPDKRQVLAQILDYGAALWSCAGDPDTWLKQLKQRIGSEQLEHLLETEFQERSTALDGIKNSLQTGIYNFLVLMDVIPENLKNLITFINENSRFQIILVEMEYYQHGDYKIFIPHLFGGENRSKSASPKNSLRQTWDESSFFVKASETLSTEQVNAVRKIYEAAVRFGAEIAWGSGRWKGSFNPKVASISVRSLFSVYSNGLFSLNYAWLDDDEHALKCQQVYKEKLLTIPPFKEAIEKSTKKYPSVPIKKWIPYTDSIVQIMEDFVRECEGII
jgi:hypothetical protein